MPCRRVGFAPLLPELVFPGAVQDARSARVRLSMPKVPFVCFSCCLAACVWVSAFQEACSDDKSWHSAVVGYYLESETNGAAKLLCVL